MRNFRQSDPYDPPPHVAVIALLLIAFIGGGLYLALHNDRHQAAVSLCRTIGLMRCAQVDPRDVPMWPAKR